MVEASSKTRTPRGDDCPRVPVAIPCGGHAEVVIEQMTFKFIYRDSTALPPKTVFEFVGENILDADLAMHRATGIGKVNDKGVVVGIPASLGVIMKHVK